MQEVAQQLKRELGLRDLVLTQILFVMGLTWFGTAAKLGPSHVTFWLLAVILFYIPSAIVVVHLSRLMPIEGGVYQWAKIRFDPRIGFLVAWNLWIYAMILMSEVGLHVATNIAYATGAQWMVESKWFIALASVVVIGAIGALSAVCAIAFAFALPRERHSTPKAELVAMGPAIRMHLGDSGMRLLFALAFLLMGSLVTTYNYIGFRLTAPPFSLSQTAIGFVFVIYLLGTVASTAAGDLAGRFGRRRVIVPSVALMPLGALATLSHGLSTTIFGVALVTVGFFAGHSVASSWIGLRAASAKAQASALYLFFYYAGSSLAGSSGGWALELAGWPGVAAFVGALACLACLVAVMLSHAPPPAHLLPAEPEPPIPPAG